MRFPSATHLVVHCKSEWRAHFVLDAIARRLAQCGLEVHPDKTRIVYCKDEYRRATYANERFDFRGYTFRPRLLRRVGLASALSTSRRR